MYKRDYSFSTKPYRHNKESAEHTSIVVPMGIPVYSPPIPTNGDTIPAENMLAKPSTAEALPAILPYLAIAIEKEAEPNRDTVHTVKNRMAVTGISGHSKSIAIKNSKEPIVSCQRANVSNCRTVITLLNLALMALAKIIPQLLIPKR